MYKYPDMKARYQEAQQHLNTAINYLRENNMDREGLLHLKNSIDILIEIGTDSRFQIEAGNSKTPTISEKTTTTAAAATDDLLALQQELENMSI